MTEAETPPRRRRQVGAAETTTASGPTPDLDAVSGAVRGVLPAVPAVPGADEPPSAAEARPQIAPMIEAPSDDVAKVPSAARVPGTVVDDYHHLPPAALVTTETGPIEGEAAAWAAAQLAGSGRRATVGPWALGLAIVALTSSLFVGWMLPVALAAVIAAIVALRRPVESRRIAIWALALGALSTLYSVGWLLWALPQLPAS